MSAVSFAPRIDFMVRPSTRRPIFLSAVLGDDDNDGRSEETPLASFAAAIETVQKSAANEIRLRRGDVFHLPAIRFSIDEPLRIGTYGMGVRPKLIAAHAAPRFEALGEDAELLIEGVDFSGPDSDEQRTPLDGVRVVGRFGRVLFEDCRFQGFRCGLFVSDAATARLWRCIFGDVLLCAEVRSSEEAIFEECMFDAVRSPTIATDSADGLKVNDSAHAVIRDCTFHGAKGVGLDLNASSSLVERSLFLSNTTHAVVAGNRVRMVANVFLGGNQGPHPAGIIIQRGSVSLEANVFAMRRRNPGPVIRVDCSDDVPTVTQSGDVVRAWRGSTIPAERRDARVRLPERFIGDARAQAFTGWHDYLRAAIVCDSVRAQLGIAR